MRILNVKESIFKFNTLRLKLTNKTPETRLYHLLYGKRNTTMSNDTIDEMITIIETEAKEVIEFLKEQKEK